MSLSAVTQIIAMSIVAHMYNTDDRFYYGSKLDTSFVLSTLSWSLDVIVCFCLGAAGMAGIVSAKDEEDDEEEEGARGRYERIP